MKDGIGKGYTREDHTTLSNQLYASYAKVQDARALASVIGEEDLSPIDKLYFEFGTPLRRRIPDAGQEREPHDRRNPRHRLEAPLDAPARRTRARLRRVLRQRSANPISARAKPRLLIKGGRLKDKSFNPDILWLSLSSDNDFATQNHPQNGRKEAFAAAKAMVIKKCRRQHRQNPT